MAVGEQSGGPTASQSSVLITRDPDYSWAGPVRPLEKPDLRLDQPMMWSTVELLDPVDHPVHDPAEFADVQ